MVIWGTGKRLQKGKQVRGSVGEPRYGVGGGVGVKGEEREDITYLARPVRFAILIYRPAVFGHSECDATEIYPQREQRGGRDRFLIVATP
jgi:hypothetical protein